MTIMPRGEMSAALCKYLVQVPTTATADSTPALALQQTIENFDIGSSPESVISDDDLQLCLFLLYGLFYGSLPWLHADWEWDPLLIDLRRRLEDPFEQALRKLVPLTDPPEATASAVAAWLFDYTAPRPEPPEAEPGLAQFVAQQATATQLQEFLKLRSIYTLREADPHSWAIPRLSGAVKSALVEIQADEYGGGDPERMHSRIFAQTMRGLGLDDTYGAYLNQVPGVVLAAQNMMSMFGINRRLRGALVGQLAAFEMTSSIPNRLYGMGFRRHGFGPDVTWYFDEHVEADAVHEQIAAHDLAGNLAAAEPQLLPDVLFGAMAGIAVDDLIGQHILRHWRADRSALREILVSAS